MDGHHLHAQALGHPAAGPIPHGSKAIQALHQLGSLDGRVQIDDLTGKTLQRPQVGKACGTLCPTQRQSASADACAVEHLAHKVERRIAGGGAAEFLEQRGGSAIVTQCGERPADVPPLLGGLGHQLGRRRPRQTH